MTKQELMDAIYELDPSYRKLKIDLNQYTEEELQICYDRKKNAPISRRQSNGGWYSNYQPKARPVRTKDDGENDYEVPYTKVEEKDKGVALSGFEALKKEY